MSASLRLEDVSVHFGGEAALRGVDIAIGKGEVVAMLGPSGSGKSTLLRAIAGLRPLDEGRVLVGGRDLAAVPTHRRGVGLMFQEHALFPHRDVAQNIAFGLRMQRRTPDDVATRVQELLELVGLAGFGGRRVQTLSGGEQQRVALARSLAPEPEVLLLDEPLGALDRVLRESLTAELRRMFTRLGLTVVAVTHDQGEAFSLADRVVLLDAGAVVQIGAPAEVWAHPVNRRAAELLGFVNIVDVNVRGGAATTPWGEVIVRRPDGPATVLVRPSGVHLDPSGTGAAGIVEACLFLGERTSVRVALDGGPALDALVATASAPSPGAAVLVSIAPSAVEVLGE